MEVRGCQDDLDLGEFATLRVSCHLGGGGEGRFCASRPAAWWSWTHVVEDYCMQPACDSVVVVVMMRGLGVALHNNATHSLIGRAGLHCAAYWLVAWR